MACAATLLAGCIDTPDTPFNRVLLASCARATARLGPQLSFIAATSACDQEPRPLVVAVIDPARLNTDGSFVDNASVDYVALHPRDFRINCTAAGGVWGRQHEVDAALAERHATQITILYTMRVQRDGKTHLVFMLPVQMHKHDTARTCCNAACTEGAAAPAERMACGGCRCAYYCSAACQNADWGAHKRMCKTNRMLRPSKSGKMYVL